MFKSTRFILFLPLFSIKRYQLFLRNNWYLFIVIKHKVQKKKVVKSMSWEDFWQWVSHWIGC